MLKALRKAAGLPPIRNRQDVRLLNNRHFQPQTRNSWAVGIKGKKRLITCPSNGRTEIEKPVKKGENPNRTRIMGLRLTPKEYAEIEKKWKASTCRKLSDYVRRILFEKPVVTTYRNRSMDDFLEEMGQLRSDLNHIGNNFNQAVKRLHTLQQIPEFRDWLASFETEKISLNYKVEEIKNHIRKIAESWLR
jgi:hypothetical protein